MAKNKAKPNDENKIEMEEFNSPLPEVTIFSKLKCSKANLACLNL